MQRSVSSQLVERIVCALSYLTFGIAGIVWLVICALTKKMPSFFAQYNVNQSIIFSIFIYILTLVLSIAVNILGVIPIIGVFVRNLVLFFTQTPIYFGYTISGLIVLIIVCYLALFALLGKYPYLPVISDIVGQNYRR